jgi:hypothetical protein
VHDRIDIFSGMSETVGWDKTAGIIRKKNAKCLSNPELLILKAALVGTLVAGSGNEDKLEIVVRGTMVEVKGVCSKLDDVEVDEIEVVRIIEDV